MNTQPISKYLIVIGATLLIIGLIWYFLGDRLGNLGKLPGDIRIEGENTRVYIPITTMIIISILLTIILNVIRKLF